MMIISRTPLRISFAGGGTDLRDYYGIKPGAVVSTAINKYVYIFVNQRFDKTIRVSCYKTEIVSSVNEIQHPIVREALKLVGIDKGIEIAVISDIPSGTGLGSSSSFTVGLLNALYAHKNICKSAYELADEACKIEIDILKEPIGKQDQYIAAYGGFCYFQFNSDERVIITPIDLKEKYKKLLNNNLILFYTGIKRDSQHILSEQRTNTRKYQQLENLHQIRNLAIKTKKFLLNGFKPDDFGLILHEGWLLKKGLAEGITSKLIDDYYTKAIQAGALGGKILGAGGGGFFLFCCPVNKRQIVKQTLHLYSEVEFAFETKGSKIIYSE